MSGRNGGRNGAPNGGRNGGGRNGAHGRYGAAFPVGLGMFGHFMVPGTAQRAKDRLDGLFLLDVGNLTLEQVEAAHIDFLGIEQGLALKMFNLKDLYNLYPVGSFPSKTEFGLKVIRMQRAFLTKMGLTQE